MIRYKGDTLALKLSLLSNNFISAYFFFFSSALSGKIGPHVYPKGNVVL